MSLLLVAACGPDPIEAAEGFADRVTFIHVNDTYRVGDVEEGRRGGFGRVATILRSLKAEGRVVRVTHGGDFLYPSLESQLWNGEQMVEALNFINDLAPLYVVPGNHEFDRKTPEAVVNALRGSKFTWVADNMHLDTGQPDVDSALKTAFTFSANGHKVGVFALTAIPGDGGNERDYAPFDKEYLTTAEDSIQRLQAEGAELIFGLTHLYLADDKRVAMLKEKYSSFMFIVGGHDHEPEFEAGDANNAMIMKGASNARTIWQIDIDFADGAPAVDAAQIVVDTTIEKDPEYSRIASRWQEKLLDSMPFLLSRIGEAAVPLDGREVAVRGQESNWGNFIADQMPGAFGEPKADFAFIHGGSLRIDDYVAEDITFEDIGRAFGFSSFLRHMKMSGGEFITLMEAGFRGEKIDEGYFPQISGFRVCVDRRQASGSRIVQLCRTAATGSRGTPSSVREGRRVLPTG